MKLRSIAAPLVACVLATACADDLRPVEDETSPDRPGADHGGGGGEGDRGRDGSDGGESPVVTVDHGDGTYTTQVDATDANAWVYFDLSTGKAVAADSTDWDLGFLRFGIKLNGGVSGPGDAALAMLDDDDFDGAGIAPASGYVTDELDATDDDDDDPELAFLTLGNGWYDYDFTIHVLSPKPRVYVVRSAEGEFYKLQMLDYYDDAGTPGFPTFAWGPVDAPAAGGLR